MAPFFLAKCGCHNRLFSLNSFPDGLLINNYFHNKNTSLEVERVRIEEIDSLARMWDIEELPEAARKTALAKLILMIDPNYDIKNIDEIEPNDEIVEKIAEIKISKEGLAEDVRHEDINKLRKNAPLLARIVERACDKMPTIYKATCR